MGSASLSQLAFLGENDPNFPRRKKIPLGQTNKHKSQFDVKKRERYKKKLPKEEKKVLFFLITVSIAA